MCQCPHALCLQCPNSMSILGQCPVVHSFAHVNNVFVCHVGKVGNSCCSFMSKAAAAVTSEFPLLSVSSRTINAALMGIFLSFSSLSLSLLAVPHWSFPVCHLLDHNRLSLPCPGSVFNFNVCALAQQLSCSCSLNAPGHADFCLLLCTRPPLLSLFVQCWLEWVISPPCQSETWAVCEQMSI